MLISRIEKYNNKKLIMNYFVIEFLRKVANKKALQKQVKNITDPNEIVNIAGKNGCIFTSQELLQDIKPLKEKLDNNQDLLSKTKNIEGHGKPRSVIKRAAQEVAALVYFNHDFFKNVEKYQSV